MKMKTPSPITAHTSIRNLQSALRIPHSAFRYWLPPLLWMVAIFLFSTDYFSANNTNGLTVRLLLWFNPAMSIEHLRLGHYLIRKAAHLTVYAILALLLLRAFRAGSALRWDWRWALYAFFIVSLDALLDEYHQSFTQARSGSPYDSLIDMTGGSIALLGAWLVSQWRKA